MYTKRERLNIMNRGGSIQERELVEQALQNLRHHTGITGIWTPDGYHGTGVDGVLTMSVGGLQIELETEIKREVRPYQWKQIAERVSRKRPFLLLAHTIFPATKDILRKEKVAYLDAAGNFFFQHNDVWIWIEGNKLPKKERNTANRAFTKTGLKVLYILLTEKDAHNLPYREIADRADVALGNIPMVINGLKDAGYLLSLDKRKFVIQNKRELLDRWVAGYGETLGPAFYMGDFRFVDKNMDWRMLDLAPDDVWGGEPAASLMTDYLEPERLTLYTKLSKMELMKAWKLVPDLRGNIRITQRFWKDTENIGNKLAAPLLVYADLMLTQDPRNMEVAEKIFDKYLNLDFKEHEARRT